MNEEHDYSIIEAPEPEGEAVREPAPLSVKDRMPTIPQLLIAISMLVLLLSASYLPHFSHSQEPEVPPAPEVQEAVINYNESPEIKDSFEELALNAEAVYVWDIERQRALYRKNPDAQLPLASLTKLMTALLVHEVLQGSQPITITLDAIKQYGENGFLDGEAWEANALLAYTLMTSSNDGAYALAAAAGATLTPDSEPTASFVAAMNVRAEQLGLSQTYFTNPTGLDTSENQSGSYGSARDMAFLMEYLVTKYPEILSGTTEPNAQVPNLDGRLYTATNTNDIVDAIPGLLGSKTGYTVLAGGNLVIAFDAGEGRPIVISVLGSTRDGRFDDVLALIEATKERLTYEQTP